MAVLEQTTCYKCECDLMAEKGSVHPLCAECQDEHYDWLVSQIAMFDK